MRPRALIGRRFIDIGNNTNILEHGLIHAIARHGEQTFAPSIRIGNDVYIGRYVFITSINSICIGDGCVLSEHVYITDSAHGYEPDGGPIMRQPLSSKGSVILEENTFVGYRAVISPGVVLGRHCIVGAQSVVTRSFPAYSMIAGAPAKLIKRFVRERGEWADVE
jgi:acetyltransferase-like isoleucine patch superfamily enzyme